jgi:basic membrane protein A
MSKLLVAVLAALALLAASGSSASAAKRYRVVVVDVAPETPIGRQIDAGLRRAIRDFGIDGRTVNPPIRTSLSSTIRTLARSGVDLVIAGVVETQAVIGVSESSPDTVFMVLDARAVEWGLSSWPANVGSIATRDEEIGFVVGYLAGLVEERRPGPDVVGSVGGAKYPTVDRLIAGYRAGARRASPGVRTLNGYSNDFVDSENCRRVAVAQIAKGAGVVFNVAGGCGLGTIAAARAARVWAIGVDQDQSSLGPHVLTSAVKRFDVETYFVIEQLVRGRLRTGRDTLVGLREGVLALGKASPAVPLRLIERTQAVEQRIASGRIGDIPTTVP